MSPDVPTAVDLTARQDQIVDVIRAHIEAHGWPPTIREIGDAVGLRSTSSVHHQLRQIEKTGVLTRGRRRSRAMSLTEAAA